MGVLTPFVNTPVFVAGFVYKGLMHQRFEANIEKNLLLNRDFTRGSSNATT